MFVLKSKLTRALQEIQRLREALAEAIGARDAYREQAREAIGLAKEKYFPRQEPCDDGLCLYVGCPRCNPSGRPSPYGQYMRPITPNPIQQAAALWARDYLADPDPFSVKNCPACYVSVRSAEWPQECPACKTLFGGDPEWPDEIG